MNNPFGEQQQLFQMWSNTFANHIPGMNAYNDLYRTMFRSMTDFWSKAVSGTEDLWKAIPGPHMFTKFWPAEIPGMGIYAKIFDLWRDMGDPVSFLQSSREKYSDLMQEVFKSLLPAGSAPFFAKPRELLDACVDFYKNVMSPWMKVEPSILERIAAGDSGAYIDFFRDFNQKYEETFDKLFNMMTLGANREANEDQMKAMGSYIKMLFSAGSLISLVLNSCSNSMQILVERYQEGLKEGKMVTSFREFYNLWYGVTEEILLALLNTDEFSKAFGDFSDKYAQYTIAMNKVYERMLASLPIPTKTDMDSLYRTVYGLRKDVRDLRRELDALKASAM